MSQNYGNLKMLNSSVILPRVANKQRQNFQSENACIVSVGI